MISDYTFNKLYENVRKSTIEEEFQKKGKQIAIISAPAIIIEMAVKCASINSTVPMDWHYMAGRGIVYAIGNEKQIEKAKQELWLTMPVHDM